MRGFWSKTTPKINFFSLKEDLNHCSLVTQLKSSTVDTEASMPLIIKCHSDSENKNILKK
jgi:hypothetical protein